jgi:homopolymeric O-antigen transport system permease protein
VDVIPKHHLYEKPKMTIDADDLNQPLNLRELWAYRELLLFFVWRNIKIRYKQTILGMSWAIIQPFTTMVIFSIFFGGLAKIETNGIPYPIFSAAGLVPWTFFAGSVRGIALSITSNANLLKKIYFPRIILPISQIGTQFVDFLLAFMMLFILLVAYLVLGTPAIDAAPLYLSLNILFIPLFVLLLIVTALGFGLWLAALNVQFRDVKYATGFLVRLWMFITPIIYPLNLVSDEWQLVYSLNPMVGVIEGFRWALLSVGDPPTINILLSIVISLLVLVSGIWFFNRMEKTFADVV